LLQETLEKLRENKKLVEDVRWCGDSEGKYKFSWKAFRKLADVEYHNGHLGPEVVTSLVVVGDDWWLERGEYDGSEWWEFKTLPTRPAKFCIPKSLLLES
jgi:hypothetical protein